MALRGIMALWQPGLLPCAAGVGAIAAAIFIPPVRPVGLVMGLSLLLLGAGSFSIARRASAVLEPLRGAFVDVAVWDEGLPGQAGHHFRIESIRIIGFGLHIGFNDGSGARPERLKVAQPREIRRLSTDGVEIGRAAYVQWRGRRIHSTRRDVVPAVRILLMANRV